MDSEPLEAGQVVIVPFPFTDSAASKRRPALVISSGRTFNQASAHAVMAMITTLKEGRGAWPLDVPIDDLAAAGLPAPSAIRMKLFTLDRRLILRRVGRLSKRDGAALRAALAKLLGFPAAH